VIWHRQYTHNLALRIAESDITLTPSVTVDRFIGDTVIQLM